jgi:LPXTG-motif cell wall-anchored protein
MEGTRLRILLLGVACALLGALPAAATAQDSGGAVAPAGEAPLAEAAQDPETPTETTPEPETPTTPEEEPEVPGGEGQEDDDAGGGGQPETEPTVPETGAEGGTSLPSTGFEALLFALVGFALLILGTAVRRVNRA